MGFEEEDRQKEEARKSRKDEKTNDKKSNDADDTEKPHLSGIGKSGAVLEQILGARKDSDSGLLEFMVKWENNDTPTMEKASVLNGAHPQAVIAFYEERLRFEDPADVDNA